MISLLLLPPVRKFTYSKVNKELPFKYRAASMFVLIIASSFFFSLSADREAKELSEQQGKEQAEKTAKIIKDNIDYFTANKEQIILDATSALQAEGYQSVITQTSKYLISNDIDLNTIVASAKVELEKVRKTEKTDQLLAELKKTPNSEYEKNRELYQQLVSLHPDKESYKNKVKVYSEKFEEEKKKKLVAEAREEQLKKQFSAWDGSHRNLERVILEGMNDPDSYEHDKTVYWDNGDHLIVQTTFRGKNVFGGVVRNTVKAKVSLGGQILKILE
jgi:hypothetical protein